MVNIKKNYYILDDGYSSPLSEQTNKSYNLYKDYIVNEYDKKYKFKIHSNRVGAEINTKHLIIKNY